MKLHEFIKKRPYLVWSTTAYQELSEGAVVEAVLNYGDFDDVKTLLQILGRKKVAAIFRAQVKRGRHNYNPKVRHYFELYFNKYARFA